MNTCKVGDCGDNYLEVEIQFAYEYDYYPTEECCKWEYGDDFLESEIQLSFMDTHGIEAGDYELEDFLCECLEDYDEYRAWYMSCCA